MVSRTVISVEAVFENGTLRPVEPLPLQPNDRVTIQLEVAGSEVVWPTDTAEIYREAEREDRELAAQMWRTAQSTWPTGASE